MISFLKAWFFGRVFYIHQPYEANGQKENYRYGFAAMPLLWDWCNQTTSNALARRAALLLTGQLYGDRRGIDFCAQVPDTAFPKRQEKSWSVNSTREIRSAYMSVAHIIPKNVDPFVRS
jgi:hypothetical protein